ncbi:hypothetical protein HPP92_027275 [Vanilla planifolia]|uniref:Plastocyanin-like domain-containing protein n=1 Tax=Vanilla planifolia TaxID=51239 RepID=A0A835U802_VANPL|nr:hypothetical protein HPP92_027275 [Vanilla planifolia]KAG0476148.1 hypothetical protein HPP92_012989 [Vanilla planifolia]
MAATRLRYLLAVPFLLLLFSYVIVINGRFPERLINSTTNDNIYVNVFNNLDEPLLMTWNGIQQRLNSWQDGVS